MEDVGGILWEEEEEEEEEEDVVEDADEGVEGFGGLTKARRRFAEGARGG